MPGYGQRGTLAHAFEALQGARPLALCSVRLGRAEREVRRADGSDTEVADGRAAPSWTGRRRGPNARAHTGRDRRSDGTAVVWAEPTPVSVDPSAVEQAYTVTQRGDSLESYLTVEFGR